MALELFKNKPGLFEAIRSSISWSSTKMKLNLLYERFITENRSATEHGIRIFRNFDQTSGRVYTPWHAMDAPVSGTVLLVRYAM